MTLIHYICTLIQPQRAFKDGTTPSQLLKIEIKVFFSSSNFQFSQPTMHLMTSGQETWKWGQIFKFFRTPFVTVFLTMTMAIFPLLISLHKRLNSLYLWTFLCIKDLQINVNSQFHKLCLNHSFFCVTSLARGIYMLKEVHLHL